MGGAHAHNLLGWVLLDRGRDHGIGTARLDSASRSPLHDTPRQRPRDATHECEMGKAGSPRRRCDGDGLWGRHFIGILGFSYPTPLS